MREFRGAYRNERYSGLYEPMRRAMAAMGKAMWWFAALKEQTWYQGYAGVTAAIHALEHKQPEYIDAAAELPARSGTRYGVFGAIRYVRHVHRPSR